MSHHSALGIFADPRKFRDDSYNPDAGAAAQPAPATAKTGVRCERRSRCFSSSPWWLMRNYLDHE